MGDDKVHTGYTTSRYGSSLRGTGNYDFDKDKEPTVYSTYGWSVLDLFNFKNELLRGPYKVPIYKPPTIINLDPRDIP